MLVTLQQPAHSAKMRYIFTLMTCALLMKEAVALPTPAADCAMPLNYQEIADAENRGWDPPEKVCESGSPAGQPITIPPHEPAKPKEPEPNTGDEKGYGNNYLDVPHSCVIFKDKNGASIDQEVTKNMCDNICGPLEDKQKADSNTASSMCFSFIPDGDNDPMKHPAQQGDKTLIPGHCICNHPLLDQIGDIFVESLPKIADIAKEVLIKGFELAIEIGIMAIPGVGEAIGPELIAGITAAKTCEWTYDVANGAKAFVSWAKEAGNLPKNMDKVYDVYKGADNKVLPKGWEPPKDVPKGSGKAGDKGCKDCKDDPQKPNENPQKPEENPQKPENDPNKDKDPNKPKKPKKNKQCKAKNKAGRRLRRYVHVLPAGSQGLAF